MVAASFMTAALTLYVVVTAALTLNVVVFNCALLSLFRPKLRSWAIFFKGKTVMLHLLKGPGLRKHYTLLRIEEEKKPSTWGELNPRSPFYEVCALPLSYNRCPLTLNVRDMKSSQQQCFVEYTNSHWSN